MRRILQTSVCIFILSLFALVALPQTHKPDSVQAASQTPRYVVTFKDGTAADQLTAALQPHKVEVKKTFSQIGVAVIQTSNSEQLEKLKQDPRVDGIDLEQGFKIPTFDLKSVQPTALLTSFTDPIYVSSQWHIRRVYADKAWEDGYTASHNTVVGVVDTGVPSNHPDLGANIVYEKCFTAYQPTCTPYPQIPANMQGNHGAVVAGPIAALINNVGVIGVAPDVGLANYNVSELDPNSIPTVYDSSIWAAMEDAGEEGIDALNFSFNYIIQNPPTQADRRRIRNYREALRQANDDGVMVIAAAGNEAINLDDEATTVIPCELPHVTCVGATNIRPQPVFPQVGFYDQQTFYTSYGSAVDISAPGGDCGGPDLNTCLTAPDPRYFIWTTNVAPDPTCAATQSCPTGYTATIGTSLSTPHVVGVAALVMDIYKTETGNELRPNQVERILVQSAEPIQGNPPIGDMVNAEAAVERVLEMVD